MTRASPVQVQVLARWETLWGKMRQSRAPASFDLELTARCNLNCRHCYINLPAGDQRARAQELSQAEISDIADQAISLGAMWCLLTGGEPLLRPDFRQIYMLLKRKGLLVSVFTNASLVTEEHVALFRDYPPRDIEVTVYGASRESYERVTRRPGSFAAFTTGLDALIDAGVRVRLKAMALHSNLDDMESIAAFAHSRTKDFYRFDPQLHLRFDGDASRNEEIIVERLTPEEVVALERADKARFGALRANCDTLIASRNPGADPDHLFHCGAGEVSFSVGYDGTFRVCSSLWAPGTTASLRQTSLRDAWETVVPRVRNLRSTRRDYLERCRRCEVINLCLWCPAHSYLETGAMDSPVEYFCRVAHARAAAITANVADAAAGASAGSIGSP